MGTSPTWYEIIYNASMTETVCYWCKNSQTVQQNKIHPTTYRNLVYDKGSKVVVVVLDYLFI